MDGLVLSKEIPWETRNLGMPSFEFQPVADTAAIKNALASIKRQSGNNIFAQMKIKSECVAEIRAAEEAGFQFAEMALDPWIDTLKSAVYKSYVENRQLFAPPGVTESLIVSDCTYSSALSSDDRTSVAAISEQVFVADRFHMDPNVSKEVADSRMALWVTEDLFSEQQQTMCSITRHEGQVAGYIVWKKDRLILGGLAKAFIGRGYAKLLYMDTISHVVQAGHPTLSTTISANNVEVLNLYTRLGFSFRSPVCVMHYWGERSH